MRSNLTASLINQRPFGIRQIARISQTTPLSGARCSGFHISAPSVDDSGAHNESQKIHLTQQLSGSALSPPASIKSQMRSML
jgi:hypothetical protein